VNLPGPDVAAPWATFEGAAELTLGIEEELMLLDSETCALVPEARAVLARLGDDQRYRLELPASQLEIATAPHARVAEAVEELYAGRADLSAASEGLVRPAAAGVHPVSPLRGPLNPGPRYERTVSEFGAIAERQLVCALQIHVAVGDSDRTVAVHNALRSYLPEVAALAANAPFIEGRDSGLASVRPKICELLPRQGVPPPIESWPAFEEGLRWGRAAGVVPAAGSWWWELRPHHRFGTLELRVPDSQTTIAEVAAVAAFAHCLVASLVERLQADEPLRVDPSWRIAENRWRAARDGVEAEFVDLVSGERIAARRRLLELIDEFEKTAHRLGCTEELALARGMVSENGSMRQRAAAERLGVAGLPAWLADRWLQPRGSVSKPAQRPVLR
jgi:carboxylate-amine ligase